MLEAGMIVGSVRLSLPLEAGGMGSVWIGEHLPTHEQVAVKFMLKELAEVEPTARDRFEREAAVLKRVQHAHVVRLVEEGKLEDGTPYIVMELLSGESLVERLTRTETPLSMEEVTTFVEQLCDALHHIHEAGIVHRDLKGENTFLAKSTGIDVKVIDFGLAKTPDAPGRVQLTMPGQQLGSPEYMSPEQIMSSGEVDEQADLWAVAVLAYVALTLKFPFESKNLVELLSIIKVGSFPPVSKLRPELRPHIDVWFARAFHLEKSQRFVSAREMANEWRYAAGVSKFRPMHAVLAAAAALVALTAIMALAFC
ncbi:MAG TPA: serine/threonine-protein kinase [Polyangiaceae bacterium]|nr:serine/threonine-protein kinase [Polyangiaceae bacterium]